MRYNIKGDLAAGNGVLSVNKKTIGFGYFMCWRFSDVFLGNSPDDEPDETDEVPYHLYQYNANFDWKRELLDKRGSTRAGGGFGNYAIHLATKPNKTCYGQFNTIDYPPYKYDWQKLAVLDGDENGRLLFVSDDFKQIVVVEPDGTDWTFFVGDHVNFGNVRLIQDGFVYLDESHPNSMMFQVGAGQPAPLKTIDTAFNPYAFRYNNKWWLFYHNNATYLHPFDSTIGYKFDASYAPDIFVEPNGSAHIALTYSPGEGPETITIKNVILGQGMVQLVNEPPIPIPPEPIPPQPIPVPPQPVEKRMKSDFTVTELVNLQDVLEVPHPQGQGTVALKMPNGKYKSLSPQGNWGDSDNAGSWERFLPGGGGWYAYRNDSNRWFVVTTRIPNWP